MSCIFELNQVTHFYGRVCALQEVTLQAEPGAIGLIGQNGAGKSTMMQILLGLIQPSIGSAHVLGRDVARSGVLLRGRIGYMPERDAMIPGVQGVEYVALAGELSGMPRKQAQRRAHETLSYLGLEEARYRKIEQYSVGMKQRLKLAATLVHDPEVLLLDEPTAGLDPDGRAGMLGLLAELAARPNRSLVLSSHLLGDIERVCRSAIILDKGVVQLVGPISELTSRRAQTYHLGWQTTSESWLGELQRIGVEVDQRNAGQPEARIVLPEGCTTQQLFQLAQTHGVQITALVPEEDDLESVYHRVVEASEEVGNNASESPHTRHVV